MPVSFGGWGQGSNLRPPGFQVTINSRPAVQAKICDRNFPVLYQLSYPAVTGVRWLTPASKQVDLIRCSRSFYEASQTCNTTLMLFSLGKYPALHFRCVRSI